MKIKTVTAVFFSPSGGTERAVTALRDLLAEKLDTDKGSLNLTLPGPRDGEYSFKEDELVILASPTYAGRVPNKIMPDLKRILNFEGSPAVALATFGNRSPGSALDELMEILREKGARVMGGMAMVTRHAFSEIIASDRPDKRDMEDLASFAGLIAGKVMKDDPEETVPEEVGPYYRPLKEDGTPAVFLKASPVVDVDLCIGCGTCREVCPMGSVSEDVSITSGPCIKCQACIRKCPAGARYFDDPDFLSHVRMLEKNYTKRSENIIRI